MKIAHWALSNGSGLARVAEDMAAIERSNGLDSIVVCSDASATWAGGMDADIHVSHSHIPDQARNKDSKIVWIGHGTPEHCFQLSVESGLTQKHNPDNSFMLNQYWMQHADALVTFWPRHQKIWQSMVDKNTKVHCIPLGIDKEFWKPQDSAGKWAGEPSLFSAENCHYIKWPLDLALMWPWVTENVPEARLHLGYLPQDMHRWFYPLMNRNGAAFKMCMIDGSFDHSGLKNAFSSIDYYIGLVRYGDYNRISLEAKAMGCKVISFAGNQYADYWLPEGDQRVQAEILSNILKGEVAPRETLEVPDISEMGSEMIKIYEGIM